MAEKKRLYWVDFAKGVGIVLVVFGHVWRGVHSAGIAIPENVFAGVDRWIYGFHMPLFFFIAGMFAVSGMRKPGREYIGDKLAVIAWPYVLWSLIHGGMEMSAKSITHKPSGLNWKELIAQILYHPQGTQFWFLYVLLMSLLAFWAMWRIGLRTTGILGVSIVLLAVKRTVGFGVAFGPIYQFADEFVFVAIGAWSAEWVKDELANAPKWALPVVGAAGLLFVTIAAGSKWSSQHAVGFVAVALAGIAMVFALSAMPGARRAGFVAELGELSLPIYVAHSVATALVRMALLRAGVANLSVHLALGVLVGMLAPAALFVAAKRLGIPGLFRWGGVRILSIPQTSSTFVPLADANGAA